MISQPTHIHGNTLDLFLTNVPHTIHSTEVIQPGLSDHFIIEISINLAVSNSLIHSMNRAKNIKLYNKTDLEAFQRQMYNEAQIKLTEMDNVGDMWELFKLELNSAIRNHVPTKEVPLSQTNEPAWFNKQAKKLTRKQRQTYNKYKLTKDPFYLEKYKEERRNTKRTLRSIRNKYITDVICKPLESGNSKPFYRHFKHVQNSPQPKLTLKKEDQSNTSDPRECADILNNFFFNQFCQEGALDEQPVNLTSSSDFKITVEGVEKLLRNLKGGKAPGPDGLRKEDLCIDARLTAKCLTLIFTASIEQGKLPNDWKVANVTPIHKKGSRQLPNNYRPISLTSIPCKMLEHIVLHYVNDKIDSILYNRQHGFRRGLSCETQLCGTYHELARSMNNAKSVHAVILDFKKAFDKVPHDLLLKKLHAIQDIHPQIINWIRNFLTKRRQQVVIDGNTSHSLPVCSGVPQGSVLGPTLFLIYINDLPDHLDCNVSLFADDTLIYQEVTSPEEEQRFQNNIDNLLKWSIDWKMPFNTAKCQVMAFNQRSTPNPTYFLGDDALTCVTKATYLGVTVQSNLQFTSHINTKVTEAKRTLGLIKRTLHNAPKKAKLLAYTSLCRPKVEYAATLWDPYNKGLIHDIEMVQNQAIRFIMNIKGLKDSITVAREQLELETLQDRRKRLKMSLLMRILSKEECHKSLSATYDELMNDRANTTIITRAALRGEPTSISATTSIYHNSFLPSTVRDLRDRIHPTSDNQ